VAAITTAAAAAAVAVGASSASLGIASLPLRARGLGLGLGLGLGMGLALGRLLRLATTSLMATSTPLLCMLPPALPRSRHRRSHRGGLGGAE